MATRGHRARPRPDLAGLLRALRLSLAAMACPLPVYTPFNAPIFGALSRPRTVAGAFAPGPITFASLAGSGSLLGFSAYRPTGNTDADADPAAPWNSGPVRKWRRRTLSGSRTREYFTAAGTVICFFPGSFPYPAVGSFASLFTGSAYVGDGGGFDQLATEGVISYGSDPAAGACNIQAPVLSPVYQAIGSGFSSVNTLATADTLTRSGLGRVESTSELQQWAYFVETGLSVETLSEPDTERAALLRSGSAVAGTATEAYAPTYAATSPESLAALAFTGARTVRASAPFSGLRRGATYTLRTLYTLRGLYGRPDTVLGATSAYVAPTSSPTVAHDLPVIPGYGVSLLSLVLEPTS